MPCSQQQSRTLVSDGQLAAETNVFAFRALTPETVHGAIRAETGFTRHKVPGHKSSGNTKVEDQLLPLPSEALVGEDTFLASASSL